MKIKIIFVLIFLGGAILGTVITAPITSKLKDREFARTEKVWKYVYEKQSSAYDSLARKATYLISQTLTVKKNKKGQIIYVPSSTMEINKIIESLKPKIDSLKINQ
jgi:hypothetical protein